MASHKIRLNMKEGKQMMQELKFYQFDADELGDTEDEEHDDGAEEKEI